MATIGGTPGTGDDAPPDDSRSPTSAMLYGAVRLGSWSVRRAVDLSEIRHAAAASVVLDAPDRDDGDVGGRVSLVLSELATNALKYGSGVATVTVTRSEEGWLVDVHDANVREYPRAHRVDPFRPSQHGLTVVTSVCPTWGWYVDSWTRRKHVWALVTRTAVPA